jgi:predicted acyltransferase (DUF342 family)
VEVKVELAVANVKVELANVKVELAIAKVDASVNAKEKVEVNAQVAVAKVKVDASVNAKEKVKTSEKMMMMKTMMMFPWKMMTTGKIESRKEVKIRFSEFDQLPFSLADVSLQQVQVEHEIEDEMEPLDQP